MEQEGRLLPEVAALCSAPRAPAPHVGLPPELLLFLFPFSAFLLKNISHFAFCPLAEGLSGLVSAVNNVTLYLLTNVHFLFSFVGHRKGCVT